MKEAFSLMKKQQQLIQKHYFTHSSGNRQLSLLVFLAGRRVLACGPLDPPALSIMLHNKLLGMQ